MQDLENFRTTLVRPRKDDVRANALARTISSLDAEIRAARRRAEAYPTLLAEHARVSERVQAMRSELDTHRRRVNEIDRLVALWPTWRARSDAAARLDELGTLRDELERVTAFADDIRFLQETRSGHVERVDKHREHLGAIETATVELNGIIERLGGVRIAPVPLAVTEELGVLKREAPEALATLRAADEALRKAVLAERESRASLEAQTEDAETPPTDEIERRISLVHRLEVTIGRERLERERVAKQQGDLAMQRALRARQRGGADALTIRVLLVVAIGVVALGASTAALSHGHGAALTALGIGVVLVGIAIAAVVYRMRRTLGGVDLPESAIDDQELAVIRAELARLASELFIDAIDESSTAAASDSLQRMLSRRRQLDDAKLSHARLELECDAARAHHEAALASLAAIDQRAARASAILGFPEALGVEGLSQAVDAISKAQELRDRIDRIRRADDLITPTIESFERTLRATEAALGLDAEEDVTRRVRRLEALLDEAVSEQATRARLGEAVEDATRAAPRGTRRRAGRAPTVERARLRRRVVLGGRAGRDGRADRRHPGRLRRARRRGARQGTGPRGDHDLQRDDPAHRHARRRGCRARRRLGAVARRGRRQGAARTLSRPLRGRSPTAGHRACERALRGGDRGPLSPRRRRGGRRRTASERPRDTATPASESMPPSFSRGTAEQLYLCLRLGFAESFAEQSVSLPLVVDDILVNFDPRRASTVARILARVAETHQVIAFTCHPHVREMFEAAAPGLRSVRLG